MTIKVIFLDIDGVLVTRRPGQFEDYLLRNLARVVEATGAKIVLSSDWRRHPIARQEAQRMLGTAGLSFIDCTPCLSVYLAQRPKEIMQWKQARSRQADQEQLSHWVAIDDRELLQETNGSYLRGHFVQTHPLRGLTEAQADECIAILMGPPAKTAGPRDMGDCGSPMVPLGRRGSSTSPARVSGRHGLGPGLAGDPCDRDLAGTGEWRGSHAARTAGAAAASAISAAVAARSLQVQSSMSPAGLPAAGQGRSSPGNARARGRSSGAILGGRP
eukprot:gnl/TRDRNA2_/TRDRNA2_162524_c1_seq1.p1 gnl/TRDRNA2_/TRDRNA2_162524_c1~~gnl/TRDRNA2_/TRDRNA2_162524_c1_seq1.p1  ORF type:complete len:273 (-),score=26.48 gnl/TRDRNA2_/TRDRNA2_162524_c1_seq1:97-915(-)